MKKIKYLIIGNGIEGLSAAREVRNQDKEGTIMLISKEPYYTYYRPKLTEGIFKEFTINNLLVYDENWYKQKNIKTALRTVVKKLDIENNVVHLYDGKIITYEKLLIATGGRPFIPNIKSKNKEGVFALRTIQDLYEFKEFLKSCNTVSVIGGGLLGLEAAWSLKLLKKEVNVIEFAPYLLPKQLDMELANKLEERLNSLGLSIYTNSQVEEVLGDARTNGIKLNENRQIPTDAVLISSGIRPNLDLVKDTAIEYDKGIKVDSQMRTNIENVYAVGDVIEVDGMILGLWTAANEQGRVAGANMAGLEKEYKQPKVFTTLEIGDIKIFSAGNISNYDKIYEYKDPGKDIHHKLFTKDGTITGVILFGDIKDRNKFNTAVVSQLPVDEFLKDDDRFN
ncbi:MAG: NAD(P)/FAD-dependent oxidoreductase [Tissierellia bacterium]|nr:NAD(P)/FAD-dependent oxidoreductase [Tissierellia bacterium]